MPGTVAANSPVRTSPGQNGALSTAVNNSCGMLLPMPFQLLLQSNLPHVDHYLYMVYNLDESVALPKRSRNVVTILGSHG